MATNSSSAPASCAARKMFLPIRPNPLIPTFTFAIRTSVELFAELLPTATSTRCPSGSRRYAE